MVGRYGLSDRQWQQLGPLLPGRADTVGVTAKDNRLFVDAVLYRYRAGIPWRDLPARFGDFRVIHTRHCRWSKKGIWELVFKVLSEDVDNEYVMLDSTIVRAHQHSAGAAGSEKKECLGLSRRGISTKIHALCDALANPISFKLTPGQASDLEGADALLPGLTAGALLADRAYDVEERVRKRLREANTEAVIPSKKSRLVKIEHDRDLYKARHLIENFFAKIKQYRAIATRYDKRACNFLGAIHLVAAIEWLN
nr:IS5 family transposase [Granulosicoccus antarcticus]